MHRDLKLGLALAVLLIGSTTAFFFRNDTDPDAGLPQLKHADELDRAVAAREVTPYLAPPVPAPAAQEATTAPSPWSKPAFLGRSVTSLVGGAAAITPDPIQIVIEDPTETKSVSTPAPLPPPERDADGTPIYVVQSGDTLSGIAGRYLGSIARFNDIYELNRDQMSGPHALKIGMRLRLPTEKASGQAAPRTVDTPTSSSINEVSLIRAQPSAEENDDSAPTPLPEPSSKLSEEPTIPSAEGLFKPAKRTPFVPSRYRAPKVAP